MTERSQNTVTLQWIPVNGISDYILLINNRQINISADEVSAHDRVELMHVVTGLTPGTEYNLTFFSAFEGVRSSEINDLTVTSKSSFYNCCYIEKMFLGAFKVLPRL